MFRFNKVKLKIRRDFSKIKLSTEVSRSLEPQFKSANKAFKDNESYKSLDAYLVKLFDSDARDAFLYIPLNLGKKEFIKKHKELEHSKESIQEINKLINTENTSKQNLTLDFKSSVNMNKPYGEVKPGEYFYFKGHIYLKYKIGLNTAARRIPDMALFSKIIQQDRNFSKDTLKKVSVYVVTPKFDSPDDFSISFDSLIDN